MVASLTIGSLFAGIGGLELGLEWTGGFTTTWQCEIDPYARRVLAKHWPNVKRYEDVREVGAHNLESVDLICGGFPCPPVSVAGRQRGLEDERWLWPEFARIVRELRPRYVLVENVPGILARPEWLGAVLGDLAAAGYDVEWTVLSALEVGAPHLRRRVFVVAYRARGNPPDATGDGRDGRRDNHESGRQCQEVGRTEQLSRNGRDGTVADAKGQPIEAGLRESEQAGERGRRSGDSGSAIPNATIERQPEESQSDKRNIPNCDEEAWGWWATEPDVGRVAARIPFRVDRLRCLGNAVVPQCARWIGERILEFDEARR